MDFTGKLGEDAAALRNALRAETCFDLLERPISVAGKNAVLFFLNGMTNNTQLERVLAFLMKLPPETCAADAKAFLSQNVPFAETTAENDVEKAELLVLKGNTALLVDGVAGAVIIDVHNYPERSIEEPQLDKTLRGARDCFTETLLVNTSLLRRRIRDDRMAMERFKVGDQSQTDIILCYIDGVCDKAFLEKVRAKLSGIQIKAISATLEGLAECMFPGKWFDPFPRLRYTERPDTAAACVLEGKLVLVMDTSPSVMILPASFFDFMNEANDFYFKPVVATYLRCIRFLVYFLTIFLTPVWLLWVDNPELAPAFLSFFPIENDALLPVAVQLLILELVIDGLNLTALNTPDVLAGTLGIIGGLLLGEFAVEAGWFLGECILYMAFVVIAGFVQPSFELGYAARLTRIALLVVTALFGMWGLIIGTAAFIVVLAASRSVDGRGYLYPVFPFCAHDFRKIFIRRTLKKGE